MENLTQTRNPATRIENDLKYVKNLKSETNVQPSTSAAAATNETKQSVLTSDLNASTLEGKNQEDENQENDDLRKRRLQHFQTTSQQQ